MGLKWSVLPFFSIDFFRLDQRLLFCPLTQDINGYFFRPLIQDTMGLKLSVLPFFSIDFFRLDQRLLFCPLTQDTMGSYRFFRLIQFMSSDDGKNLS